MSHDLRLPENTHCHGRRRWAGDKGAELVEFALVLPFLIVISMAIFDFGSALTTRDKLDNAAREGVRVAVNQDIIDLDQTSPASVQVIRDAVANYVTQAGLKTCTIGAAPTKSGNAWIWTYPLTGASSCTGKLLTIERAYTAGVVNGSTPILTRVTLQYPYNFISFHRVVTLIAPGAKYGPTITMQVRSVMQNLTP